MQTINNIILFEASQNIANIDETNYFTLVKQNIPCLVSKNKFSLYK